MKLITRQLNANGTAQAWKESFSDENGDNWWDDDKKHIYQALVNLGENPDPEDVDRTIGNKSWIKTECDECGVENKSVVQLGENPNIESHTACICFKCLKKAVDLINN